MIAGQIDLLFDNIASGQPHSKDGKLRPLAETSATRSPLLPGLPTVADTVLGFESVTRFGVFSPRGMPADAVVRLNGDINAMLKSAEFQQRLRTIGYDAAGGSPSDFARVVQRGRDKWSALVHERKITID